MRLKSLTREQKEIVYANGIMPDNWALVEQTEFYLKIEHRLTHTRRRVDRYVVTSGRRTG